MIPPLLRALLLVFLLPCLSKRFPPQLAQFKHCNNCYAVCAYDIIKYHQPRLNVTLADLMRASGQTCNGGVPTLIFDKYFPRGSRKTSGSLLVLKRILRKHGPCVVSFGKGHLVTASINALFADLAEISLEGAWAQAPEGHSLEAFSGLSHIGLGAELSF